MQEHYRIVLIAAALTLSLVLVACSSGRDDNSATDDQLLAADVSPTDVPVEDPTPTLEPEPTATPEPEPTATPESEPTPERTPTPAPARTPEPTPATTPEPTPVDDDDDLFEYLLDLDDLPGGWYFDRSGEFHMDRDEHPCNVEPLRDELLATPMVDVEFESEMPERALAQLLTRFPSEDDSVEAFAWFQVAYGCDEWVDDFGTVWHMEQVPAPDVGEGAFALQSVFEQDEELFNVEFVFARHGRFMLIIGQMSEDVLDSELTAALAHAAVAKLPD